MHPRGLRCSSLKYSRYSRSSRLAREAPRPSRCDATLSPRAVKEERMRVESVLGKGGLLSFTMSVLLCAPARAQVDTGTILGTVKDQSGAVLPGATVTITHEGQALTLSTVTREDGTYTFTPIRTGAYAVDVEFEGFKKGVRRGI